MRVAIHPRATHTLDIIIVGGYHVWNRDTVYVFSAFDVNNNTEL